MTERNYGNDSNRINRLRRYRISNVQSGDTTKLVLKPDCLTRTKETKGVPNIPLCNALCNTQIEKI